MCRLGSKQVVTQPNECSGSEKQQDVRDEDQFFSGGDYLKDSMVHVVPGAHVHFLSLLLQALLRPEVHVGCSWSGLPLEAR